MGCSFQLIFSNGTFPYPGLKSISFEHKCLLKDSTMESSFMLCHLAPCCSLQFTSFSMEGSLFFFFPGEVKSEKTDISAELNLRRVRSSQKKTCSPVLFLRRAKKFVVSRITFHIQQSTYHVLIYHHMFLLAIKPEVAIKQLSHAQSTIPVFMRNQQVILLYCNMLRKIFNTLLLCL